MHLCMQGDRIVGFCYRQVAILLRLLPRQHCHHFPTYSLEHLSLSLKSNLALHSLLYPRPSVPRLKGNAPIQSQKARQS
jgi:hypothetical protein